MQWMKKTFAAVLSAAMLATSLPAPVFAASTIDELIRMNPAAASPFHDTNDDGLGEFEGWGSSLCWWAYRVGYDQQLTEETTRAFFSSEGLNLNIGRYNIGGGDLVLPEDELALEPNEDAIFFDMAVEEQRPSHSGSKMTYTTYSSLASAAAKYGDADFGIAKGEKIGDLTTLNWISALGSTPGSGSDITFTISVEEAGDYSFKFLMHMVGAHTRSLAMKVNGETLYELSNQQIKDCTIATTSNINLYDPMIQGVALQEGENTVVIGGGNNNYMLDFDGMCVIPSGKEKEVPYDETFMHAEHIIRSDSAVPGYCVDVTAIDLAAHDEDWYTKNFARADFDCGYAWNYDWKADANQINVLKSVIAQQGDAFIAEAFSNSPPYFMTVSGCSSGNITSSSDNLRADSVNAFAKYLADVIEHWIDEGIEFTSAEPMNEPNTDYWGFGSAKQEGCHFSSGESMNRIYLALDAQLQEKGLSLDLAFCDETSIDLQITDWNALSDDAKAVVDRIDTHTYGGTKRTELKNLAVSVGRDLWMSEVDGSYTAGTNSGEMSSALGLAGQITKDLNGLQPSAWILWNLIDKHIDSSEYGQSWIDKESKVDVASEEALWEMWTPGSGFWGVAAANHDTHTLVLSKKFYGFGQYTRYIQPGYILMESTSDTVSAYDPEGHKAVFVTYNTSQNDKTAVYDLSAMNSMGTDIEAIRTSGTLDKGENWADVSLDAVESVNTKEMTFQAQLKGNSITTFIVSDVTLDLDNLPENKMTEISVDNSWISGTANWNQASGNTNTFLKVNDNDLSSFFDGLSNGWVQYDLQKPYEISAVAIAPRTGYTERCKNARVLFSNDGETWVEAFTISGTPTAGVLATTESIFFNEEAQNQAWRYVRYEPAAGTECNLAELKVYGLPETEKDSTLLMDLDMSAADGVFTDVSGNGHDAVLHNGEESDSASWNGTSVFHFDASKKAFADIPAGAAGEDDVFTIQTTVRQDGSNDAWLWTLGTVRSTWPNVNNYLFVSVNSAQGSYSGKPLAAVKVDEENRMPVPTRSMPSGYATLTLVSESGSLKLYLDGELISELSHSKDVAKMVTAENIIGFIGQSLYTPDPYLEARISEFKIYDRALSAQEVVENLPSAQERRDMILADVYKEMMKNNESVADIKNNLSLPSQMDGVALTWSVADNTAIASDGTVTVPEGDDVNTSVTVSFDAYGQSWSQTFRMRVCGLNTEALLQEAWDTLDIPNKDDIRGNITLPETLGKVSVSYSCDHPEILKLEAITDDEGTKPAGVIVRPQEDTVVHLTATLEKDGQTKTKEFDLTVKAAAAVIEESDYTDYFFAYFAGEGYSNGEQIYFAGSSDGLHWKNFNNNEPVLTSTLGEKGVRDPYIIRSPEGDTFYLIATDLKIYGGNGWTAAQEQGSQSLMVWESHDLVNWSSQRMVEISASIDAGCTWAPEAVYDSSTGEYVVFWASKTADDNYSKQRVWYAKTRDFYTFTEPQLFVEKDLSAIDTTMIYEDGAWYRFTKNEGGDTNEMGARTKTIFLETSSSVLGEYKQIASDSLNDNQYVEGPTIYKLNEDDSEEDTWILLVDDFGGIGYYPLASTDLSSGVFEKLESGTYQMPSRARHGTPIRLTADEYAKVVAEYGTSDMSIVAAQSGDLSTLPETISVAGIETAVTWNTEDIDDQADVFTTQPLTGTLAGGREVSVSLMLVPEKMEYLIDCANDPSYVWQQVADMQDTLLNEVPDKALGAGDSWGRISVIDNSDTTSDGAVYGTVDASDPFAGGFWARGNKTLSYQLHLSEGQHVIYAGCRGWWNMGRNMTVTVSEGGHPIASFALNAKASANVVSSTVITLSEDADVTVTVAKADSNDPILSWIGASDVTPDPDKSALQAKYDELSKLDTSIYTTLSVQKLETALTNAKDILDAQDVKQSQIDAALAALNQAEAALVEKATDEQMAAKEELKSNANVLKALSSESQFTNVQKALDELGALGEVQNAIAKADMETALTNLDDALRALGREKLAEAAAYAASKDISAAPDTQAKADFVSALNTAAELSKDETATLPQMQKAAEDLQSAWNALAKEMLAAARAYADAVLDKDAPASDAKSALEAAITQADALLAQADPDADEMEASMEALIKASNAFARATLTDSAKAAQEVKLDEYADGDAKTQFVKAGSDAASLLADANSDAKDMMAAAKTLDAARLSLEKAQLKTEAGQAEEITLDDYVDGPEKEAFEAALAKANALEASDTATLEELTAARQELAAAAEKLVEKEPEPELDTYLLELILSTGAKAGTGDSSKYQSNNFETLAAQGKQVLENATEQSQIDYARSALSANWNALRKSVTSENLSLLK